MSFDIYTRATRPQPGGLPRVILETDSPETGGVPTLWLDLGGAWVQVGGGPASVIKSIQAFSITIGVAALTATATISAVNTSKAAIWYAGKMCDSATQPANVESTLVLTNSTTVTATRNQQNGAISVTIVGSVIEFV